MNKKLIWLVGCAALTAGAVLLYPFGSGEKQAEPVTRNVSAPPSPNAETEAPTKTTPVVETKVSEAVRKIVDDSGDVLMRVKLVNRLSRNLSEIDRLALCDYLKQGVNSRETNHLKNDILNVLRDQTVPPPELTQVMLDIFYDENQSMAIRSYALQHMRPWYWEENMRDPAIRQAFYNGLEQTGNELSGVALLALAYLSEELPDDFNRNDVAQKAAALANTPSVSELTRVSALDISSRYGNASALEAARNILKTETDNVMLRAAACGVIGRMGDVSDLEILQQAGGDGSSLRVAVNSAEVKINRRSGNEK